MIQIVLSVRCDSTGRYWASRVFSTPGQERAVREISGGSIFVLEQNEGETPAAFEERARREARARGIAYVERLDGEEGLADAQSRIR